ncbi:MAG: AbrB/MazE/SpoVT family DNA-binding domain-containing protein [Candidatus Dormibacteraceae bacterium]
MDTRRVVKVGNSLAVTLPVEVLQDTGLGGGDLVNVKVVGAHIEIEPSGYSLAALAEKWTPIGENVSNAQVVAAIRKDRDQH